MTKSEKDWKIGDLAWQLANEISERCPPGEEKDRAIAKLEECRMWARESIAGDGEEEG